jgi:hypothetical protein
MKWIDDWSNWIGSEPWYIQLVIGLVVLFLLYVVVGVVGIFLIGGYNYLIHVFHLPLIPIN